jgi:pimeloyl-ACP methyl ester carboxylesterase
VQRFVPLEPKAKYPLLLWHGGGLTGATWEDTPDGRPGWNEFFLRCGHETLVSDASERGRASWARYPEINTEQPEHRTIEMAWEMFRFGPRGGYHPEPAKRVSFPGQQFPVEAAGQFLKQFVARWTSQAANEWAQMSYLELVSQTGPSVILAHSQGAYHALKAAAQRTDEVRALICIEPVIPFDAEFDLRSVASRPILIVIGDYQEHSSYLSYFKAFLDKAGAVGGSIELLDLPSHGINGNSHMLMMDRNSDDIAQLVQAWITASGLMK